MTRPASLPPLAAVKMGETTLSLRDVLQRDHQRGRLVPWMRRTVLEAFLLDQARVQGLNVETAELQQAADLYRRRRQLLSAAQFQDWLRSRRLTVDDFEAVLERRLLLGKLRTHVTKDRVAEHFQADLPAHDRLRLRRILVPREDLAREVLTQLIEEGAEFGALARRYSLRPGAQRVGRGGVVFRGQLPPPVRNAVAGSAAGAFVGPVATPLGFEVILVEEVIAARLDPQTAAVIGARIFSEWARERQKDAPMTVPLLDLMT